MSLVEEIEMNSNCNKQINNTKIVYDSYISDWMRGRITSRHLTERLWIWRQSCQNSKVYYPFSCPLCFGIKNI